MENKALQRLAAIVSILIACGVICFQNRLFFSSMFTFYTRSFKLKDGLEVMYSEICNDRFNLFSFEIQQRNVPLFST